MKCEAFVWGQLTGAALFSLFVIFLANDLMAALLIMAAAYVTALPLLYLVTRIVCRP